jgi:hypothetical protein
VFSRLPVFEGIDSPPPSPLSGGEGATAEEVEALQDVVEGGDEASCLQAQLDAMQAAIVESEQEAATAGASHAEAQARLLGRF